MAKKTTGGREMKRMILAASILALGVMACVSPGWVAPTPTMTESPSQTKAAPTVKEVAETRSWTSTVVRPIVRVHASPDSDEITGYLSGGDEVTILGCSGDWCQIKKPAGYVFRGCLSDNPKKLGCQAK